MAGTGITAGGVILTGGSVGWKGYGSLPGGVLLTLVGMGLSGLGVATAVKACSSPHNAAVPRLLPVYWATVGVGGLFVSVVLSRTFEKLEIGPFESVGFLGLVLGAAIAGGLAGLGTTIGTNGFSRRRRISAIAGRTMGWALTLSIAMAVALILGMILGELLKPILSPALSPSHALVAGWALGGAVGGLIPGLASPHLVSSASRESTGPPQAA